jgi:hypothetical protein
MISENLNEEEQLNEESEPEAKPFLNQGFVRGLAILFVFFLYLVIFMKILFLE